MLQRQKSIFLLSYEFTLKTDFYTSTQKDNFTHAKSSINACNFILEILQPEIIVIEKCL